MTINSTFPSVWVSGASRGIGRAIALRLARDGYAVALNASRESAELTAVADEITAGGGKAIACPADVSDYQAVSAAMSAAAKELGDFRGCVICAGINLAQPVFMTSPDSWRKVISVNLDSAFWQTKYISRSMMSKRRGHIVYISSDAALSGDALHSAYSASKAGILGLMRSTARELAPFGITVNAVAPGPVDTDMTAALSDAAREKQNARIPMGRFAKPEEIASVVSFLLSDDSAYITGQTLSVDGGLC